MNTHGTNGGKVTVALPDTGRQQLLALWKRYREADDYNRPAVKLLLRNVINQY